MKKKIKRDYNEEESFRDFNQPMLKDEMSFATTGLNIFA